MLGEAEILVPGGSGLFTLVYYDRTHEIDAAFRPCGVGILAKMIAC